MFWSQRALRRIFETCQEVVIESDTSTLQPRRLKRSPSFEGAALVRSIPTTGVRRRLGSNSLDSLASLGAIKRQVTFKEVEEVMVHEFDPDDSAGLPASNGRDVCDRALDMSPEETLRMFLRSLDQAPKLLEKKVEAKRRRDFGPI